MHIDTTLSACNDDDTVSLMVVEECEPVHHPRIEPIARMLRNLTSDVKAILEPLQLSAGRGRENRDFAVFALVTVLHRYARVSEKRGARFFRCIRQSRR